MVSADVSRTGDRGGFVLEIECTVGRTQIGYTAKGATQILESWEAAADLPFEAKLRRIVILNTLRRSVRIVITLIPGSEVEEECRSQRLIVVDANGLATDDLIAAWRDRIGKT